MHFYSAKSRNAANALKFNMICYPRRIMFHRERKTSRSPQHRWRLLRYLSSYIFQPIWVFYRTGADSFCMRAHIIHSSLLNVIQYRGRTGSFRSIMALRNRHSAGYTRRLAADGSDCRRAGRPIHPVFCCIGTTKGPEMKRRRK